MFIPLSTQRFSSPASEFAPGPAPFLEWIETDKLVVDVTYQREIGRRGATNVNQIAENFDWSKFAPVIVAPEGGQFATVDGQHRTTAAILRGQEKVPCQVVQADRAKQACGLCRRQRQYYENDGSTALPCEIGSKGRARVGARCCLCSC